MQNLKMSRESRKIFQELEQLANVDGVNGIITPGHIFVCDRLVIEFYTAPMINLIKSKLKVISKSKREWKHYTIEYWEPMLRNMLSKQDHAKRSVSNIIFDLELDSFTYIISNYLISDYSLDDALLINHMIGVNTLNEIINACQIGKSNKVYEPRYINAILDKEKAKKQIRIDTIDKLTAKTEKSDIILDKPVHQHSLIDIALAEYQYQQKLENAELEKRFKEILK